MTWWLWLLLVVAALVLLAVLGLRLWRKGKALLRELEQLSVLGTRLAEITEPEPLAPLVPGYLAGAEELAAARQQRSTNLRARHERRGQRAASALDRWHRLGLR